MENTLGDFLRSRRARIRPEDLGLPAYGRRRVPGLRREELAQLAGVSVDYYTRLEQGRGKHVSDEVLDAVARVLALDPTERAHLRDLARPPHGRGTEAARSAKPAQRLRPGVQRMLESIADSPAVVVGRRMEVLGWNALGEAVHGVHGLGTSMPRVVFLDPDASTFYPDWPAVAAETVAYLRLHAGRHPDDTRLAALVGELSMKSDHFRRLWADHLVKDKTHGLKRIRHPLVGELVLEYETLLLPGDPDQTMVVYVAAPGSATAERLSMLASWNADARPHAHTSPPRPGPAQLPATSDDEPA
jgi:transcriptional regulator with XRE-family HTH domain